MKKLNTRSILFVLLITASVLSYVYLNSANVQQNASEPVEEVQSAEKEEQSNELLLPDVRFIKKMVETGKRFLPAS